MGDDDLTRRIRRVLFASGGLKIDFSRLGEDDDLYAAGLKSVSATQLMLALEEEFDIEFPDGAAHRGAFASIASIRDTVADLLTSDAATGKVRPLRIPES